MRLTALRTSTTRMLVAVMGAVLVLSSGPASVGAVGDVSASQDTTACPWVGSDASPTARAYQVLEHMTLDQKLELMWPSANSTPGRQGYQQVTLAIPELCVPSVIFQGSAGGVRGTPAGTATQLPSPLSVGASFDRKAAAGFGLVQGEEARAKGIDGEQAPYVNIDRVPLAGRTAESYGEDPYLTSALATADINALNDTGTFTITQSFAAYSQEQGRNREGGAANVLIDDQALREVYMAPIEASVDAGAAGLMCTYTQINGVWSCQDPYLIQQIINEQWEFQGFVRTDFGSSHDDIAAINAGNAYFNPFRHPEDIAAAVESGEIPLARLNNAVVRILRVMFEWGAFDRVNTSTYDFDARTPAHVAIAREMAQESMVLLKNEGVLPLDRGTVGSVALIGPRAGDDAVTIEGGSAAVQGTPEQVITPVEGIEAAAGPHVDVSYYGGTDLTDAAAAAAAANVAIVVVAYPAGEFGDIPSLTLPDDQDALIEAVAAANPNTIVVINSGNAVLMPWLGDVAGVFEAWYPGEQYGNALASLLFGDANPSGKLPISFPTSEANTPVATPEQYPGAEDGIHFSEGLNVGYRGYQALGIEPMFPFGYGLSYTSFKFSHLTVSPGKTSSLGDVSVGVTMTNTGDRAGADVPQLYLAYPAAAGEPPLVLRGFDKVTLGPGQSTRVKFILHPQDLRYWSDSAATWVVAPGTYGVRVGDSSVDLPLGGVFEVAGTTGARAITIDAPSSISPGATVDVTATLGAGGDMRIQGVTVNLDVPEGWTADLVGDDHVGILAPDASMTVTWRVTAPADAPADVPIVTASASFQAPGHGGGGQLRASAEVMVASSE